MRRDYVFTSPREVLPRVALVAGCLLFLCLLGSESVSLAQMPIPAAATASSASGQSVQDPVPDRPNGLNATYIRDRVWDMAERFYSLNDIPAERIIAAKVEFPSKISFRSNRADKKFSAEWRGYLLVSENEQFRFALISKGRSCLYLDRELIVDNWIAPNGEAVEGSTFLNKGMHPIAIRYALDQGEDSLRVYWALPGKRLRLIPKRVLFVSP